MERKIVSILSGQPQRARSRTARAAAPDRAAELADELARARAEGLRLADEASTATAECARLTDALEQKSTDADRMQEALDRLRATMEGKEAAARRFEIEEAKLRSQLGAAQDALLEATRARQIAERAMQAAIERQTTVIDRTVAQAQISAPPTGYELIVTERDANDRTRRIAIKPTGGG